jgi:tetratricopeptide (TPR) repeat protein
MMTARPGAALTLAAAALFAPLLPLCHPAQLAAQTQPDPVRLFEEGVARFNQRQFREAAEIFRAVFELDPNPFVLFNIGRCYEELGDAEAAVRYYQRALALDGFPRDARLEAITRLEQLEPLLEQRDREAALMMARSATGLGALSAEREASREAQARLQAQAPPDPVEPPPLPPLPPMPPPPPTRGTLSWVGLGVSGLGLASLGTGLAFTLGISDDLDQQAALRQEYLDLRQRALNGEAALAPQALRAGEDANALASDIKAQQLTAGLFLGAGALCVVGGLVLFAVDTPGDALAEPPRATWDLWLAPQSAGLRARW